jgi:hypothetical protein
MKPSRWLITIVLLVSATSVADRTWAPTAGAAGCGGSTSISGGVASAGGWCATNQPGRQEGLTMEQLWNAYCVPYTRPYRGAVSVDTPAVGADGLPTTTTETVVDTVTLDHVYDHPVGDTPEFLKMQFDFMVRMGWDPTSVVAHYGVACSGHEVSWRSGISEDTGAIHFTVVDPVPVETLRDNALAKIPFNPPGVGSAPPIGRSIVNLSNWLWVDTPWVRLSDSDGQGAVTVEVFAEPIHVDWTFDDDYDDFEGEGSERCDGPGEVWRRGADEDASDCQYTFHYPSSWNDAGVFKGTATVSWDLTWSINGEDQGSFGTMTRTSAFDVNVVEIQTVGESG